MKQLDVYVGTALAGLLREHDDGSLGFTYAPEWMQGSSAAPLAPDLPLQADEQTGDVVLAYFDNLLPEGSVRDFIARAEHISATNVFGLLERFGGDTAGAISLLPQGERPSDAPRYRPVDVAMIRECFATSRGIPLGIGGEQVRMSLSGAQDKMTVFIGADGGMALPLGNAPTSHIIKPTMGYRPDLPQTAVNEALVMRLAQAVRLDVPDVRYDAELDAVVIARYDRAFDAGGQLRRLHQNDLCQVMGVPSGRKYEAEGGPSLKACFTAVGQHSSQPALDKKRLIEWVVFNVAAGNMDSHAKNLSMLVGADGKTRLAPFYDMVCTTAYPRLSGKFAFKVGGENRPGWIMDRHWERFAEEIEAKPQFVNKIRLDMVERIERALPVVANALRETVRHADGLSMIDRVEAEVRRFTGRLRARAAATPGAELQQQAAVSAEGERQMQYASYKAITATPQTQADFLREVREGYEAHVQSSEKPHPLHEYLRRNVQVGGEAFSQVKHLTALENDSYDWDLDEAPVEVRKALAEHAEALHQIERGYDVPHFITGFTAMVNGLKEQGVNLDLERKVEPKQPRADNVSADFDPT